MQLAKHVKFREEKFGGVLFETRSEKVFTLDATAAAVVREIAAAVRGLDRIVLTHGHVDHCGSAAELQAVTGARVLAGAEGKARL